MNTESFDLPAGIQSVRNLPDVILESLWSSIFVEEKIKEKLLSQALLNFTLRKKISSTVLPLHGVILLVGPPGTGKTSLAKGLASKTAQSFKGGKFRLVEVEPHGLTSSAMGKTQRAVANLFSQTLVELAIDGPTIVLLDEVETLAVDRSKLSLDANPVDIHRATDAVLVQLDILAERNKDILFIATSNFPQAVDSAFTSRCDLIVDVPKPNSQACKNILESCIDGLSGEYPKIASIKEDSKFGYCAKSFLGLDGRAIRKVVASALAANKEVALDPNKVTIENLIDAAHEAKRMQEGEWQQ